MKFREIQCFEPINEVSASKVDQIAESIKDNGFIGCPILIYGESLITGSHRLMALRKVAETQDISEMIVAEDVTEIVDEAIRNFEEENGYTPDIRLDDIGWMFKGTWVEKFRDEIEEW